MIVGSVADLRLCVLSWNRIIAEDTELWGRYARISVPRRFQRGLENGFPVGMRPIAAFAIFADD